MTRISRKYIIAIAVGLTVSGFTTLAQTGSANASNVLSCDGAGRQPLIQCCEAAVMEHGRPIWMRQNGKNCLSATIKCTGGGDPNTPGISSIPVKKRCWYVAEYDRDGKKKHEPKSRDKGHDPAGAPN